MNIKGSSFTDIGRDQVIYNINYPNSRIDSNTPHPIPETSDGLPSLDERTKSSGLQIDIRIPGFHQEIVSQLLRTLSENTRWQEQDQDLGVPLATEHDISFLRSGIHPSELVVGDGYRIHTAVHQGMVRAVKVYEGRDALQKFIADIKLNRSLRHPNILKVIAACRDVLHPFAIFSAGLDQAYITGAASGMKTLVSYMAGALVKDEQQCITVGAQLMRDVSSSLSYLVNNNLLTSITMLEDIDLLIDERNNICVSIGANTIDFTTATVETVTQQTSLQVFHNLLGKAFDDANKELYYEKRHVEALDLANNMSFSTDLSSTSRSASLSSLAAQVDPEEEQIISRREFVWVPDQGKQSLQQICDDSANFLRLIIIEGISARTLGISRRSVQLPSKVRHRCPRYRRLEVTFTPSIRQSAVVSYATPAPGEVCPVCGLVAETGGFQCVCGRGDDGHSSTIQCRRCSMWHHRHCTDLIDVIPEFLCFRCCNMEKLETSAAMHSRSQYYVQPIPPFHGRNKKDDKKDDIIPPPPAMKPSFKMDVINSIKQGGWSTLQDVEPYWRSTSFQITKLPVIDVSTLRGLVDDQLRKKQGTPVDKAFWGTTGQDDKVDLQLLGDLPAWLHSLGLEKYTSNFRGMSWKDVVVMDEGVLEARTITGLGDRRKLLKTSENVLTWLGINNKTFLTRERSEPTGQ